MNAMNATKSTHSVFAISAFSWAVCTLLGFASTILVSPLRGYDVYDINGGLRALSEQPLLVIGGQVLFAWAGAALVVMVLAYYELQPVEYRSFSARAAMVFGLISAVLFTLVGLVGGFSSYELRYLLSNRSVEYVQSAYLPLAIIANRTLSASITVAGVWFILANLVGLKSAAAPDAISYLGLAAGGLALFGFFLPGGGFGLPSSILMAAWGLMAGFASLKTSRKTPEKEVVRM